MNAGRWFPIRPPFYGLPWKQVRIVVNSLQNTLRWAVHVSRLAACSLVFVATCSAQTLPPDKPTPTTASQLNVNWLYGSYVPKQVPLEPLNSNERFKLYLRQTYTTPGIYIKTALFTLSDQAHNRYPQWGDGFDGFAKRLGTREGEFVMQNSVIALGDGIMGWEPRYDRCRCSGFWARTRHAVVRNFVTYDANKSLRPQLFTYAGAFAGSVAATTWVPGKPNWRVEGYQAVITQVPVGIGINWIAEFAPEIIHTLRRKPIQN